MSYKSSSRDNRRDDHDRSRSRRDSPPRRSRRSPSPAGPSKPRDPKSLPETFGRMVDAAADDDLTVIQRMKNSYVNSPLHDLYTCVKEEIKVKIWTRNFKEVRGILSGYVIAFDKHWNLILRDVGEVYLKPKKSKTPFLRDVDPNESLPDMPVKKPREKKSEAAAPPPPPPADPDKKKKRRKKLKKTSERRNVGKLFVRGDNIVMISPLHEEGDGTDVEEEEEEVEDGHPVIKIED